MAKGYAEIRETIEGKFFANVKRFSDGGKRIQYQTPSYVTEQMAFADAYCWMEFHMGVKAEVSKVTATRNLYRVTWVYYTDQRHVVSMEASASPSVCDDDVVTGVWKILKEKGYKLMVSQGVLELIGTETS